jgi:hypothetical protein
VPYTSVFDPSAIAGFVFVLAVVAAAAWCRRNRETRPIAFGLAWFLITPLPTSWVGLDQVEKRSPDVLPLRRTYLRHCLGLYLLLHRLSAPRPIWLSAFLFLLAAVAWVAHQRNEVWRIEETLWYDVTEKSPVNGRGLMNYGLSQMRVGRYERALRYFQRALVYNHNYATLEVNLGIVNGAITGWLISAYRSRPSLILRSLLNIRIACFR